MATEMSQIKATANAHLRRDVEAGHEWTCDCEACREMRSLVGMEKVLQVRPVVRDIREVEDQMGNAKNRVEMQGLMNRYLALYDQLAEVMAK